MKISHTRLGYMNICLTDIELQALRSDYVMFEFQTGDHSTAGWLSLKAAEFGSRVTSRHDATHPWEVGVPRHQVPKDIPIFGTEEVQARLDVPLKAIQIFKPKMKAPVQKRILKPKQASSMEPDKDPVIERLRDAVKIVNNSKKHYRDQLILTLDNEGKLEARLSINLC